MWDLDHEDGWVPKNWCFLTVVLEKTLESPLDCKEIQSVHPKGDQSWVFIGRTDVEAETPILWPPDAKSWLTGKNPDAGKDCGQEMGATEDETVGWHHWLNGHEFEQTPGDSEGPGKLGVLQSMGSQRVRHDFVAEELRGSKHTWYKEFVWNRSSGILYSQGSVHAQWARQKRNHSPGLFDIKSKLPF